MIFPDEGCRYRDAVYDDAWLAAQGAVIGRLPEQPVEWERPHDGGDPWSFFRWGRRSYREVMDAPALAADPAPARAGAA